MTKERRLAIEMWQAIREKLCNGELQTNYDLHQAKRNWLVEHKIYWYSECWFCHYFRQEEDQDEDGDENTGKTSKCPLNCDRPHPCFGTCKQYHIAHCSKNSLGTRLAAIDNIIKALKGEYKE